MNLSAIILIPVQSGFPRLKSQESFKDISSMMRWTIFRFAALAATIKSTSRRNCLRDKGLYCTSLDSDLWMAKRSIHGGQNLCQPNRVNPVPDQRKGYPFSTCDLHEDLAYIQDSTQMLVCLTQFCGFPNVRIISSETLSSTVRRSIQKVMHSARTTI